MKRGFIYTISAFAVSIIFLTSISFLYTSTLRGYIDSRDKIDTTQSIIIQLYKLSYHIREAEQGQRSFLLSSDSAYHRHFKTAQGQVYNIRDSVAHLIKDANLRMKYSEMNMELIKRLDELENMLHNHDTVTLQSIMGSHPVKTTLTEFIEVIEQQQTEQLRELLQKKQRYEKYTGFNFQLVFFFALIIFIISFIVLLQQINLRNIYHRRMEEKIKQTNQANKELERLTFIASHDLQEPLRKIRTFSNLLGNRHANELTEESRHLVERIEHSATIMQELIRDLGNYTSLVRHHAVLQKADLNEVLSQVNLNFAGALAKENGRLQAGKLPAIWGYPDQLIILFSALVDNSLKFTRPGIPPVIMVTHGRVKGTTLPHMDENSQKMDFHVITFSDNGLGFDEELAEKMFMMFQRLHNDETGFAGRGMGLAIAKRVMVNHNGNIIARGQPGEGANFELYFPV
jgi:signal transduction histidine kinase